MDSPRIPLEAVLKVHHVTMVDGRRVFPAEDELAISKPDVLSATLLSDKQTKVKGLRHLDGSDVVSAVLDAVQLGNKSDGMYPVYVIDD